MPGSVTDLDTMVAACADVAAVVHLGGHSREAPWARDPRAQHQRHVRGAGGGAAGRRAAAGVREQQPRGGLPAGGRGRGGLPVPAAGHVLRGEQGGRGGAGQPVPRPVRAGRDLPADRFVRRAAVERAGARHVAVPGRLRAAGRGGDLRAVAGFPRGVGHLGQHAGAVVARRGAGAGLRAAGRRGGVRRRTCHPPRSWRRCTWAATSARPSWTTREGHRTRLPVGRAGGPGVRRSRDAARGVHCGPRGRVPRDPRRHAAASGPPARRRAARGAVPAGARARVVGAQAAPVPARLDVHIGLLRRGGGPAAGGRAARVGVGGADAQQQAGHGVPGRVGGQLFR